MGGRGWSKRGGAGGERWDEEAAWGLGHVVGGVGGIVSYAVERSDEGLGAEMFGGGGF